ERTFFVAYLVQRLAASGEWSRHELPAAGGLLALAQDDPTRGLSLTPVALEDEFASLPDALGLFVPVVQAGRVRHAHLTLAAEAHRNADHLPLAGLTVLRDRDCLFYRVGGAPYRLFYDAFSQPVAQAYSGEPLAC